MFGLITATITIQQELSPPGAGEQWNLMECQPPTLRTLPDTRDAEERST